MRARAALFPWIPLVILVWACGSPRPPEEPQNTHAEPTAAEPAPPPPTPPKPSLYERLGKKEALSGIVDELLGDVLADNRINKLFDKTRKDKSRAKQLSARLVAELCVVAGGSDCAYDGKSMKEAHDGMNVTGAQWDAFVEDLTIAMKTRGIDDAMAKELVDRLEQQTKGDIVIGKGK